MEFLAGGQAALGAIMISIALTAWGFGRWQGGIAGAEDTAPAAKPPGGEPAEAPAQPAALRASGAAPCLDAARAERRTALAAADSLGELHAEISAYRRAQRVLAGPDAAALHLDQRFGEARSQCRHLGVMGEPTCGFGEAIRSACACGTRCNWADPLPGPAVAERLPQPSPASAALTRV